MPIERLSLPFIKAGLPCSTPRFRFFKSSFSSHFLCIPACNRFVFQLPRQDDAVVGVVLWTLLNPEVATGGLGDLTPLFRDSIKPQTSPTLVCPWNKRTAHRIDEDFEHPPMSILRTTRGKAVLRWSLSERRPDGIFPYWDAMLGAPYE